MPRNGSGTYSRTTGVYTGGTSWGQTRDANRKILASDHDTHDQDLADAISSSIAKDGQTVPTANLPMGGFRHTGVGDGASRTDYATVKQVQDSSILKATATSADSGSTYTASLSPAITSYVAGLKIYLTFSHTNLNSIPQVNLNGLGLKAIVARSGGWYAPLESQLMPQTIIVGNHYELTYDGGKFIMPNSLSFNVVEFYNNDSLSGVTPPNGSVLGTVAGYPYWKTAGGDISPMMIGNRTTFTPSNLTPTAGTVTGGTKTGWYQNIGNLVFFEASYVGFTQNTSTSTTYTASLPFTGVSNIASVPFSGYDSSTGLMLTRCSSSSSTAYILARSGGWTATSPVNLYISGFYFTA